MFEKVITVQSTQELPTSKGTPYLKVTDTEDKTVSIFDSSLWGLFQEGASVKLSMEKEGKYWNVKSAELATAQQPKPGEPNKPSAKPKEDDDTRLRCMILSYAKDIAVAETNIGKGKGLYETLIRAEIMFHYLKGEITIPNEVIAAKIAEIMNVPKEAK